MIKKILLSKPSLLAVLLYAKGPKGEIGEEIIGKTKLMKLMFLIFKETDVENYIDKKIEFKAYKYGPFDSEIYDCIDSLENLKIIEITDGSEKVNTESYDNISRFKLTKLGIEKTSEIVKSLPPDLYRNIETIKRIYSNKSLIQLLYYVYSRYPEYTIKSELKLFE
jgi:uncharacterized phage-associated protein